MSTLRPTLVLLFALSLVTGVAYPLAVTAVAQLAFPRQANGSLVVKKGEVVGSALLGQPFDDPRYFWGRPSPSGATPYDAVPAAGSNLGPTNPALADAIARRVAVLRASDPENRAPIPVDLATPSASGLDPDISPAAALFQVDRVAEARGLDPATVRALVEHRIDERPLGILGERRVDVLTLNLALDAL